MNLKPANMDVYSIVIVLSAIFNLLSCAKLDNRPNRTTTTIAPITPIEFINPSADLRSAKFPPNPKSKSSERKSRDKAPITDDENIKEYVDERNEDNFDDDTDLRLNIDDSFIGSDDSQNGDNNQSTSVGSEHGEPPTFTNPDSLSLLIPKPSGNMVKIRCAAMGKPEPNITWTKDDQMISRSMGKVQRRKWAIILEDLTPKDNGHYKCRVCNIYGCIEHTTRLDVKDRVNHKPIIKDPPQNSTKLVGTSITFKCSILSDLNLSVQWFYSICNNCSNQTLLQADEDVPEELVLRNITRDDEGWYTCIAANSLGTSASSAYLEVLDEYEQPPMASEYKLGSLWGTVLIIALAAFFLLAIFIMLIGFKKLKHEKLEKHRAMETVHQWTKKVIIVKPSEDEVDGPDSLQIPVVRIEKQRTTMVQSHYSNDPSMFNEYEFPLDSNWEFPRNLLKLGPTLGEGAFGRVVMAEAHGLIKPSQNQIVAVKMVKEGHTDSDMTSLVREMEVMKMIGKHINIINLLGCCSQDGPLYVIVEYAPHGNLKDFLKKNLAMADYNSLNTQHLLTQKELTSFAFQVARGMEYLASRRCIHRDLAARNVLVCDDYIVKIADFGLARELQESDYYRKSTNGRLPIKWMAPESISDKFYDSQSDVWSYGVLLWEIMSFGEQPYPHLFSSEHLYSDLKKGIRMEKPQRCPINIYALTRQCWNWDPQDRPTFTEIVMTLDSILTSTSNEEYLDLVNVPYLDETSSIHSEDDEDIIDGYPNYQVSRPFIQKGMYF